MTGRDHPRGGVEEGPVPTEAELAELEAARKADADAAAERARRGESAGGIY
ncbi:hypothetical protein [Promicromonospora sp. NPDC050880]|uniref:hypothetical protein n=1 Tax=Promicromonospora sp. NPDC050880 TaxID=3364406 RepID=UPI0037B743E2